MKLQPIQVAEERLREDQREAALKQRDQQIPGFQPDKELAARRHEAALRHLVALRQQDAEGKGIQLAPEKACTQT